MAAVDLTSGLIDYFALDETGTGDAPVGDHAGHTLTVVGTPGVGTDSLVGRYRTFTSTANYCYRAYHVDFNVKLNPYPSWAVSMWVRKTSLGGASDVLVEQYDANPNEGWLLRFQTSDVYVLHNVHDDGTTNAIGARPGIALDTVKWHLVAAGHDSDTGRIWCSVDGNTAHNRITHSPDDIEINSPTTVLWTLGTWHAAANSAKADIAHVSWWKGRTLSNDDLDALYNGGSPLPLADYPDVAPASVTPRTTFLIHQDDPPFQEPVSYGYTHTDLAKGKAAYCIVNETGSDTVVRMTMANVSKQAGMTSNVSNRNALSLHLISAYVGGDDVSSTMTSMDTTKSVPANVSLIYSPTSYTKSSQWRKMHAIPQWSAFTGSVRWGTKTRGTKWSGGTNLNLGAIIDAGGDKATSATQGITLRPGEGIGIEMDGLKLPHDTNIEITWTDGTDTFFGRVHHSPMYTDPMVAFFNESGSGEVVTVVDVTLVEGGDTSEPIYDIMKVEKVFLDEGEPTALTAHAYDTADTALPSGVSVYRDVYVNQLGASAGAAQRGDGDAWAWGRSMVTSQTTYRLTSLIQFNNWYQSRHIFKSGVVTENEVLIRPGEAIALMKRRHGQGGRKEFSIEFTAVQTPTTFPFPPVGPGTIIKKASHGS